MSVDDTSEETAATGADADNGTDGGRRIDSDVVSRPCGEKYGTDSRNVTSADTKLSFGHF